MRLFDREIHCWSRVMRGFIISVLYLTMLYALTPLFDFVVPPPPAPRCCGSCDGLEIVAYFFNIFFFPMTLILGIVYQVVNMDSQRTDGDGYHTYTPSAAYKSWKRARIYFAWNTVLLVDAGYEMIWLLSNIWTYVLLSWNCDLANKEWWWKFLFRELAIAGVLVVWCVVFYVMISLVTIFCLTLSELWEALWHGRIGDQAYRKPESRGVGDGVDEGEDMEEQLKVTRFATEGLVGKPIFTICVTLAEGLWGPLLGQAIGRPKGLELGGVVNEDDVTEEHVKVVRIATEGSEETSKLLTIQCKETGDDIV
jgi:hypothetical protein